MALVLALLIKTFLVQAFSIPSDSMQNTLQRGDRVLVDKLTPWFGAEPGRGEVVVFRDPGNWLEGEPAPEPNAVQKVLGFIGLMPSADEKDLIKRVIAIGGDTVECRRGGPVKVNGKALHEPDIFPGNSACDDKPFGDVVGRAVVVAWPLNRWATLPVPETFDQPGIDDRPATAAPGVSPAVPR